MIIPERYIKAKRKAIESLYCGSMNVYNTFPVKNEETNITEARPQPTLVIENAPCRLSWQSSEITTTNEPAKADKQIRVICAPELNIPAGSIIEITQHNYTQRFKQSGHTRYFSDHQSIPLKDEREYV